MDCFASLAMTKRELTGWLRAAVAGFKATIPKGGQMMLGHRRDPRLPTSLSQIPAL